MWYIFLCVLTVLSSSNSSLLIAGNYFLRKAQFVLEKQVTFCYKPQCYSPIWWSNLKEKPLLNLGAGFLQRWKQPLSFPAWSRPMVPSAGNKGPCSMLPAWILHPEHRTGVLQLSGLNWRYTMVILSGSEVVVVLTGMRFRWGVAAMLYCYC